MNTLISKLISVIILILSIWVLYTWLTPQKIDVKPAYKESKTIEQKANKLKKEIGKDEKIQTIKPFDNDFPVISLQPDRQPANKNIDETQQNIKFLAPISENTQQRSKSDQTEPNNFEQQPKANTYTYPQPCPIELPDNIKMWNCDYSTGEWK